jgi:hypothetical protein
MRPLSRLLISGAALAAALAPALRAEVRLSSLHALAVAAPQAPATNPGHLLPIGSGDGTGLWIAPTDTVGLASANLYDDSGRLRFTLRASLTRYMPANGMTNEQGGLFGVLFSVDRNGVKKLAGQVVGTWVRHVDGTGNFGLQILARSKNPSFPLVQVGAIEGVLSAPLPAPVGHLHPYDPAAPAKLTLTWEIFD